MNKLLRPKDFQNLISSNSSLYKAVNQQSEYKKLYEERWGRTGFELEEKNWIIAYQKKCQKKH
jgi:phage anti-repressor protein